MNRSSLQVQLKNIAKRNAGVHESVVGGNKLNFNKIPSILFDRREAADQDSEFIYNLAITGVKGLGKVNSWWEVFYSICRDEKRCKIFGIGPEIDRSMMTITENRALNKEIDMLLMALSPYILYRFAQNILEYLFRVLNVHEANVDTLMITILPYHETDIYVKIISVINVEVTVRWSFLKKPKELGINVTRNFFVSRCSSDSAFILRIRKYIEAFLKEEELSKKINISSHISFYASLFVEFIEAQKNLSVNKDKIGEMLKEIVSNMRLSDLSTDFKDSLYFITISLFKKLNFYMQASSVILESLKEAIYNMFIDNIGGILSEVAVEMVRVFCNEMFSGINTLENEHSEVHKRMKDSLINANPEEILSCIREMDSLDVDTRKSAIKQLRELRNTLPESSNKTIHEAIECRLFLENDDQCVEMLFGIANSSRILWRFLQERMIVSECRFSEDVALSLLCALAKALREENSYESLIINVLEIEAFLSICSQFKLNDIRKYLDVFKGNPFLEDISIKSGINTEIQTILDEVSKNIRTSDMRNIVDIFVFPCNEKKPSLECFWIFVVIGGVFRGLSSSSQEEWMGRIDLFFYFMDSLNYCINQEVTSLCSVEKEFIELQSVDLSLLFRSFKRFGSIVIIHHLVRIVLNVLKRRVDKQVLSSKRHEICLFLGLLVEKGASGGVRYILDCLKSKKLVSQWVEDLFFEACCSGICKNKKIIMLSLHFGELLIEKEISCGNNIIYNSKKSIAWIVIGLILSTKEERGILLKILSFFDKHCVEFTELVGNICIKKNEIFYDKTEIFSVLSVKKFETFHEYMLVQLIEEVNKCSTAMRNTSNLELNSLKTMDTYIERIDIACKYIVGNAVTFSGKIPPNIFVPLQRFIELFFDDTSLLVNRHFPALMEIYGNHMKKGDIKTKVDFLYIHKNNPIIAKAMVDFFSRAWSIVPHNIQSQELLPIAMSEVADLGNNVSNEEKERVAIFAEFLSSVTFSSSTMVKTLQVLIGGSHVIKASRTDNSRYYKMFINSVQKCRERGDAARVVILILELADNRNVDSIDDPTLLLTYLFHILEHNLIEDFVSGDDTIKLNYFKQLILDIIHKLLMTDIHEKYANFDLLRKSLEDDAMNLQVKLKTIDCFVLLVKRRSESMEFIKLLKDLVSDHTYPHSNSSVDVVKYGMDAFFKILTELDVQENIILNIVKVVIENNERVLGLDRRASLLECVYKNIEEHVPSVNATEILLNILFQEYSSLDTKNMRQYYLQLISKVLLSIDKGLVSVSMLFETYIRNSTLDTIAENSTLVFSILTLAKRIVRDTRAVADANSIRDVYRDVLRLISLLKEKKSSMRRPAALDPLEKESRSILGHLTRFIVTQ